MESRLSSKSEEFFVVNDDQSLSHSEHFYDLKEEDEAVKKSTLWAIDSSLRPQTSLKIKWTKLRFAS